MGRKLLVVDDDAAIRRLVRSHLEPDGWEISEAGSVAEALAAAAQGTPSAVVLDVNLPDGEGFEVCRRLKESAAFRRVPILMVSGYRIAPDDKVRGLEGGAVDYIAKPFKLSVLSAKLEALVRA